MVKRIAFVFQVRLQPASLPGLPHAIQGHIWTLSRQVPGAPPFVGEPHCIVELTEIIIAIFLGEMQCLTPIIAVKREGDTIGRHIMEAQTDRRG